VKFKKSFFTVSHLGHSQLQLDKFSDHEIGFISSSMTNCSLWLPYEPSKLSSIRSIGNQEARRANRLPCTYPIQSHFQHIHNGLNTSVVDNATDWWWKEVEQYVNKRWTLLSIPVMLFVCLRTIHFFETSSATFQRRRQLSHVRPTHAVSWSSLVPLSARKSFNKLIRNSVHGSV